jgi:hypothetical protein
MKNPTRIAFTIGGAVLVAAISFGCAHDRSNNTEPAAAAPAPVAYSTPQNIYNTPDKSSSTYTPPTQVASNDTSSNTRSYSNRMDQERPARADRN